MVFTGATLGLFFSYYRHPPLVISIKWLSLTLVLNSVLLLILWNERVEAEELKNDAERVSCCGVCCFDWYRCDRCAGYRFCCFSLCYPAVIGQGAMVLLEGDFLICGCDFLPQ